MQTKQRRANQFFLLGLGLICLVVYTVFFAAFTLIAGHTISGWQFPAAALSMLITVCYASGKFFPGETKKIFLQSGALLAVIILVSIFFSQAIYDSSIDGQWYHQETVFQLKTGWNPYHKELIAPKIPGVPDPVAVWCSGPHVDPKENPNADQPEVYLKYVSINHFAKGIEICQAAIYAATGRIETGKATNLFLLLASVFLCLSLLDTLTSWNLLKKWILALLICLNPVVIYQLTSFCLDGFLYSTLVSVLTVFFLLGTRPDKFVFFLFGLLVILAVNIKFTAVVYVVIFCGGFFFFLIWKKNWELLRKFCIAGSIYFILGFAVIGYHPYMTNLLHYGNVFEGLKETQEENAIIRPTFFKNKNRFENFMLSYGAHSYYDAGNAKSVKEILKLPFTFNKKEWENANTAELEVAGFGPFFSGALIFSAVLLGTMILRLRHDRIFRIGIWVLLFLFISVFIIPDPWWARFAPHIWLFPCIVLVLAERTGFPNRFLKTVVYISVSLNILWALSGIFMNILVTAHINYQMAQIKALSQPVRVEYCGYYDQRSNGVRFQEHHIPFVEANVSGKYIYNIVRTNTRFETNRELPHLPEPFLMRLSGMLKNSNNSRE
jgi:hypothetical protein